MKTSNNWEKDLQDAKAYCQQVNGLSHCKNCGIDFDRLASKIREELASQKDELEKKHKREIFKALWDGYSFKKEVLTSSEFNQLKKKYGLEKGEDLKVITKPEA